jgi:hypothetical protein
MHASVKRITRLPIVEAKGVLVMVRPIDGYNGETRVPLNAWLAESDSVIWSNVAQCMRVAGAEVQDVQHLRAAKTLGNASERSRLAYAEGEIAKARAMAAYLVEPDRKARARKAINRMALCVRRERGV